MGPLLGRWKLGFSQRYLAGTHRSREPPLAGAWQDTGEEGRDSGEKGRNHTVT